MTDGKGNGGWAGTLTIETPASHAGKCLPLDKFRSALAGL